MKISLLQKEETGIVIVDVQEKLVPVMSRGENVIANIQKSLLLAKCFDLPVILTEQYPKWLGSTVLAIKKSLPSYDPVTKMAFNCCDDNLFNSRVKKSGMKNLILTGLEAHICVFQTCVSLVEKGFVVHVPVDAVDSRTEENRNVGLDLMKAAGAIITSTETVIYQIMKKAGTSEFREMLKVIK
ncbi:Isochorismatase [hydrothermal vent metagenome]|uniref:Isochorismatase n=1 Tax=hydrothermal vent metagenome TaxID=652676 RepID=A0A3B1C1S9_9ZZZZ